MKSLKQRIVETLQPLAERAFCPTGEGGGIDNSCSPNQGGGDKVDTIDHGTHWEMKRANGFSLMATGKKKGDTIPTKAIIAAFKTLREGDEVYGSFRKSGGEEYQRVEGVVAKRYKFKEGYPDSKAIAAVELDSGEKLYALDMYARLDVRKKKPK